MGKEKFYIGAWCPECKRKMEEGGARLMAGSRVKICCNLECSRCGLMVVWDIICTGDNKFAEEYKENV